jgi:hypothetical protein
MDSHKFTHLSLKPSLPLHLLVRFRSDNPVSWLGLDRDLQTSNEFSRISKLRELSVVTNWKLGSLFPRINLFVRLLGGFPVAMVVAVNVLMVGQSTMMPLLGSSGLKIKYLLAPVRLLWARNNLNSGCMTLLVLGLSTTMATMVSSRKRNTTRSVPRECSCSLSLVWEHSINIPRLSELFKQ